jgi:hypothetical protein
VEVFGVKPQLDEPRGQRVRGIIVQQSGGLEMDYVRGQLEPLAEVKGEAEIMQRLNALLADEGLGRPPCVRPGVLFEN